VSRTGGAPGRPARVGWVIVDQLARSPFCRTATLTGGGVGLARYAWLAAHVNAHPALGVRHEVFRPWRRYEALVFLKAMGPESLALLRRRRALGTLALFDANVNYYEREGREHYRGMLPTEAQRDQAIAMTREADAVIADSEVLRERCRAYNAAVTWIPDSVDLDRVPAPAPWQPRAGRLPLLWSGEAVKLFELLAIEEVLLRHAARVELVLVTNDLAALGRWTGDHRARFEALLARVPHRIVPYRGIAPLFAVYAQGGVLVSPRFLDNSYNLGHTEWKVTLGMACGRMALASPVPSYVTLAARAGHRGIRICATPEDWDRALAALLAGDVDRPAEEAAARGVVARHYATPVVARAHAALLTALLAGTAPAAPAPLAAGR
jgi:glycosyltransferase involved in cell wall biosynthesis